MNCQEFGHTKSYCKLRSVCVVSSSPTQCEAAKQGLKKSGNCGGNHSTNYRGCPVYKELLKRLKHKQTAKSAPKVITMQKDNFTIINIVNCNEKSSLYYLDALKSCSAATNTSEN